MRRAWAYRGLFLCLVVPQGFAHADGDLSKVNHIIVVVMENHSFDNYLGALAYAPGSPYQSPRRDADRQAPCRDDDHRCVDGLACTVDGARNYSCFSSNLDIGGGWVRSFHDSRRCVSPDLDHEWIGALHEANFAHPNLALFYSPNDGFVRQNDLTEQIDTGRESSIEDQTMAFYDQREIPFYYDLAMRFAISDRYFSSVLGPTFPNRSYILAGTSFGHVSDADELPPPGNYQPINGTIFDLLDAHNVAWGEYFQDVPFGGSFRTFSVDAIDPHFFPLDVFLAQAAGSPDLPPLPQVAFIDPAFGFFSRQDENDEHPPTDVQRGQAFVSLVVNAVRGGPNWKDSIIIITYDENGGFYDHVRPPRASQGLARNPDGVSPGQCSDLSNPPASLQPGGGAECSTNFENPADNSVADAIALCPPLGKDPTGQYPLLCANFDQLGFRVPFIAVSPFSKPRYVSHTVSDHTSLLALIEKRFLHTGSGKNDIAHVTLRDAHASTLEDLFDFDRSPSLNTPVTQAAPPADDCTPP
jgi:phospholipase C